MSFRLRVAAGLVVGLAVAAGAQAHTFAVEKDHYVLDGKPYQVISGELHYARIPREYWRARLKMARAMGLNTVATYVFWNVHEPKPGVYDFSGNYDLAAFVKMAQEEGLHVLLRAGPYSCAEWEFGGFPAWLLKDPRMSTALRTNDDAFMVPAERWMKRLAEEMAPLLAKNGGPIIAVQVENEYGNFGGDPKYMEHMLRIFQGTAFRDSLLYTVDPSKALARGSIEGVPAGVNFGTGHAAQGLAALAALRPGQPLFATEYWPGWFDLWGHPHETRPIAPQLEDLNYILSHGASLNIYMFHGGTSYGQMAGASQSTGNYRGNVTSYDYDAPLDEAGHPTAKFYAYRDVILKYTHEAPLPVPEVAPVVAIPEFTMFRDTSLSHHLEHPLDVERPLTMEQVDQSYGYVLYRNKVSTLPTGATLKLLGMQDFAIVYVNGKQMGTLDRHYHQDTLALVAGGGDGPRTIEVLVENTGRLNSTKWMRQERKGMTGATLNGVELTGWQEFPLPMDKSPTRFMDGVDRASTAVATSPEFEFGRFSFTKTGDAFLDVSALGKGLIWINGHALGRFWNIGPQNTLYVPAPWLKQGTNEVAVFELLPQTPNPKLVGRLKPILNGPTPGYADDPERKKKAAADAEFGTKLATPADTPAKPKE